VPRATGRRTVTTAAGDPLYLRPGDEPHGEAGRGLTAAQIFAHDFAADFDGFDDYVSDPAHQLYTIVALEPVLEVVARGESTSRAAQLEELGADLNELLAALAEDGAALDGDPLWLPRPVATAIRTAMQGSRRHLAEVHARLHQVMQAVAGDR
jgi:hypothetical protein